MKRTIWAVTTLLIVFATLLTVLLVRPLGTVKAHRGCSNRTLVGDYGWTEFGLEAETTGAPFWTQTGLVHFDGTGTSVAAISTTWRVGLPRVPAPRRAPTVWIRTAPSRSLTLGNSGHLYG